ncbi:MAG: linear amide C-N hydrolase, partial [Parachlamydiaceae bacterium]
MIQCILMAFLLPFLAIEACTGLKLVAKDGKTVHGRTLEFGQPVEISIAYIPKGSSFAPETDKGEGLKYETKYSAIGAIAYDELSILDGINEKGLAVGTFYFPGFAKYTELTRENQAKSLSPVNFP